MTNESRQNSAPENPIELSNDSTTARELERPKRRKVVQALVALVFIALIAFVIADSVTNRFIRDGTKDFLEWVEDNPTAGVFAFMGVYIIATVLFIPGSVLTLGIGFIFANTLGLALGTLLSVVSVFVGASIGAIFSFLLGRYLLREWVQKLSEKHLVFAAVDSALEQKGCRIMTLLRLSPIIPFNALNYIAGITSIRLVDYIWAMIAILPGTILYVYIGASAGSLLDSSDSGNNRTIQIVSIVLGIVFGILGVGTISYYAKKELNAAIEHESENTQEGDRRV